MITESKIGKALLLTMMLIFADLALLFGQDFLVEQDLRLDWVFYDKDDNVMLPFLDNSNESPEAIHLSLDAQFGNDVYLKIEVPANTSFFIDNKLMRHYEEKITRYFLLDSIMNQLNQQKIRLTLYRSEQFDNPANASIGFIHTNFDASMNVNPVVTRELNYENDYLMLIILIVFTFFVVLFTLFPHDLFDFLSLRTLITFRFTDTAMIKYRSITNTQTLVIVFHAALSASLLLIFLKYYSNPFGDIFFMKINPIFGWLSVFCLLIFFLFLKFVLISIISSLFGISDKINFYFIEFLRVAFIFYSLLFVIISFAVINQFYFVGILLESLVVIIIIFNLIRFLIIYFKFRATVSVKNLHLFSYLCTTELIPLVLGLKFFLK